MKIHNHQRACCNSFEDDSQEFGQIEFNVDVVNNKKKLIIPLTRMKHFIPNETNNNENY